MKSDIWPLQTGLLQVSKLHKINYMTFGNKKGTPVISFHGGPGGSAKAKYASLFDLNKYYVVLFDQRGCGKSEPFGEVKENNPENTAKDAAALLDFLNIKKAIVCGLSYGATCALLFAEKNPGRVLGLYVGMIYIPQKDFDSGWFLDNGAKKLFPSEHDEMLSVIKTTDAKKLFDSFEKANLKRKKEIAAAVDNWETILSKGLNTPSLASADDLEEKDVLKKRVFLWYSANYNWGVGEYIMKNLSKLKGFPISIFHGKLDFGCPISMAWELKKKLPMANFIAIPFEGHGGEMTIKLYSDAINNF
jgi:proline iminopeptidase